MTAESRQKVLNLFLKELENETHKSETAEVEHICKDGEKKWCEVTVSFAFDRDNHPIGIIGVTRDISERKRIEQALRESEKQLQALMDNAPVAVTWTDVLGNYKYMNHKFSELFGYTIDDVPTMRQWTKRSHPDLLHSKSI